MANSHHKTTLLCAFSLVGALSLRAVPRRSGSGPLHSNSTSEVIESFMKKTAGIAAGVIVVAGAVATIGAWYTGTQLKDVLNQSLVEANEHLATAALGSGLNLTL